MPLSDFFPSMQGAKPVTPATQAMPAPQMPNEQTQVSGYLRTTLPLPLQYSPDTLKQYNRPGLSSFRIAPIPPGGNPSVNAASTSSVTSTVQQFVNTAAGGSNGNVQFNASGGLAGSNNFNWNNVASILSISGSLTVSTPIAIVSGGTGTTTPALVAGNDITITGSWPNNNIAVKVQSGVTPGSYTSTNLTVDAQGIITAVSSGSGSVDGGTWNVTATKVAPYTAVAGDMVIVNTSGGGIAVTIPLAASNPKKSIRIKKISADLNNVTPTASGGDLIDGSATQPFNGQYTDMELTSDGVSNWWIA